jgi:hypothetical protein
LPLNIDDSTPFGGDRRSIVGMFGLLNLNNLAITTFETIRTMRQERYGTAHGSTTEQSTRDYKRKWSPDSCQTSTTALKDEMRNARSGYHRPARGVKHRIARPRQMIANPRQIPDGFFLAPSNVQPADVGQAG